MEMTEAIEVEVSMRLWQESTATSPNYPSQRKIANQQLAVCNCSGVLAVANGPVVDLYQLTHLQAQPTQSKLSSNNDTSHNGDNSNPEGMKYHMPFLTHISLMQFQSLSVNNQRLHHVSDEDAVIIATSVCFVESGFLLVGGRSSVPQNEGSSWLFGFRIYISVSTRLEPGSRGMMMGRESHPVVHFSFCDEIPSFPGGISEMKWVLPNGKLQYQYRESAYQYRSGVDGVVLMILAKSSCFAVFTWNERFSDRQLNISSVRPDNDENETGENNYELVSMVVAVGSQYQYMIGLDTIGNLFILDCPWLSCGEKEIFSPEESELLEKVQRGKRVRQTGAYRSGLAVNGNPLHEPRLLRRLAGD